MSSCALTGHRILKSNFDKEYLESLLLKLIFEGTDKFYCGMAIGFDILALKILYKIKQEKNIKIIACLPCKNQTAYYKRKEKEEYETLLEICDEKIIICDEYITGCMQMRNRYMVDNSDIVLAYLYKNSGGTYYTVSYAQKKDKKIIYI